MGAAAHTYDGLSNTYQGFMVPSAEVLIGGENLETVLHCKMQDLKVNLDLSGEESASFSVWDCYDFTSRSLKAAVKSKLLPGSKVEVKLGYGSERTTVFLGYIGTISVQMSAEESFSCNVTAYDVKKLMQESGKRERVFKVKKYTEVFQTIMGDYGDLCSAQTDMEEPQSEAFTLEQRGTDLQFVRASLLGQGLPQWTMVISGGIASLKKKATGPPTALVNLGPGSGLKSFQWSRRFINKKLVVLAYSGKQGKLTAEGELKAASISSFVPQILEVVSAKANSQKQVDNVLAGKIAAFKRQEKLAQLSCIGIPQYKPGAYIGIEHVDESVDGTYYITRASHSVGENGYMTDLTVTEI